MTFIPLKSLLVAAAILFPEITAHFQARFINRTEIPFRLHESFSDFQARLAGLKILARFEKLG